MMKKIATLILATMMSNTAFADDEWVRASNVGSQSIDFNYTRCFYKTDGFGSFANQKFSFIIRGGQFSCPNRVEYNPLTGEWRD